MKFALSPVRFSNQVFSFIADGDDLVVNQVREARRSRCRAGVLTRLPRANWVVGISKVWSDATLARLRQNRWPH